MNKTSNPKQFDLEDRTFEFARAIRGWAKETKFAYLQQDDVRQVIRSSGSVAANYIEANESLSRKDFAMRIKICRKEAKESILWLKLLGSPSRFIEEATELMKIFGAIVEKTK